MRKSTYTGKESTAKGLVAAAAFCTLLCCTTLPALAQTGASPTGTGTPRSGGTVPPPKEVDTDKGTYTTEDTVGRKATGNAGTYGNTRDLQDGSVGGVQDTTRGTPRTSTSTQGNRTGTYGNTSTGTGLPLDTTRREGSQYGNTGTAGPRPRQDTTGRGAGSSGTGADRSRSGAAGDTIDGGGKASQESGSRTNDGSQLNGNRTRQSGCGRKQ